MSRIFFPKCTYCGASDPRKCHLCDKFICYECWGPSLEDGECYHRKYTPIPSTGWTTVLEEALDQQRVRDQLLSPDTEPSREVQAPAWAQLQVQGLDGRGPKP